MRPLTCLAQVIDRCRKKIAQNDFCVTPLVESAAKRKQIGSQLRSLRFLLLGRVLQKATIGTLTFRRQEHGKIGLEGVEFLPHQLLRVLVEIAEKEFTADPLHEKQVDNDLVQWE